MPNTEYCVQFRAPQYMKVTGLLEQFQERVMKIIKESEHL